MGRLFSIANLGVRFWAHFLKKPLLDPEETGRARFDENYRGDALLPYSAEHAARLPLYETCLNCGLCDAACAQIPNPKSQIPIRLPPNAYRLPPSLRPSLIPVMASRAQPLFHASADLAAFFLSCGDCNKCEEACPNGIPIKELAKMVVDGAV
jgi:succinate dehydrogenase/fumarate reductase-like Fe-S protein